MTPRLWSAASFPKDGRSELGIVAAVIAEDWCAEQAKQLLERRGLRVDAESELKLAKAVAAAMQRASLLLARLAEGHSEGDIAVLAPSAAPVRPQARAAKPVRFDELVDGWMAEKRPAEKTIFEWHGRRRLGLPRFGRRLGGLLDQGRAGQAFFGFLLEGDG